MNTILSTHSWLNSDLEGCNHINIQQQSVVTALYGILLMLSMIPVNANTMFYFSLSLRYFLFSIIFIIWTF